MSRGWSCIGIAIVVLPSLVRADGDSATVRFVSASEMAQGFVTGAVVTETSLYEVHASHRDAPGVAEVHTRDTDVIYVVEGHATFVTGGRAVDAKTTAPGELRGARIDGGESHRLAKGDVVIVPNGVPHWFTEVTTPFDYFVVKVTAPAGDAAVGTTAAPATEGSER